MASANDTDQLVERAAGGDPSAAQLLLRRHRDRLRRMVDLRMDPRLRARIDPSDVVQEALADAWQRLPVYLDERPVPFYPWIRQIAWNRLVDLYRHHIVARKRSVEAEAPRGLSIPDASTVALVERLAGSLPSPSCQLLRRELRQRVTEALDALSAGDREVIILRHLERLSMAEVGSVLGITEGSTRNRHLRAIRRLRSLLVDEPTGGEGR